MTFLLSVICIKSSEKRLPRFQNRIWSPSSEKIAPDMGSQNSGSKISTMHRCIPLLMARVVPSAPCRSESIRLSGRTCRHRPCAARDVLVVHHVDPYESGKAHRSPHQSLVAEFSQLCGRYRNLRPCVLSCMTHRGHAHEWKLLINGGQASQNVHRRLLAQRWIRHRLLRQVLATEPVPRIDSDTLVLVAASATDTCVGETTTFPYMRILFESISKQTTA